MHRPEQCMHRPEQCWHRPKHSPEPRPKDEKSIWQTRIPIDSNRRNKVSDNKIRKCTRHHFRLGTKILRCDNQRRNTNGEHNQLHKIQRSKLGKITHKNISSQIQTQPYAEKKLSILRKFEENKLSYFPSPIPICLITFIQNGIPTQKSA